MEASTIAFVDDYPAVVDLVEEIYVDPTAGNTKTVDPAITPPLSL